MPKKKMRRTPETKRKRVAHVALAFDDNDEDDDNGGASHDMDPAVASKKR